MKIRVFTAFSGYDSQCLALDRLKEAYPDFDYELVGWSEIDKYAIQAHNALYPQWADRNFGDISKIDWSQVPDFDLFTYSSPCQDFSNAGKQAGGEKGSGTRSSLLWECQRAIEAKRPAVTLMENVAALVGTKFIKLFNEWQLTLNRMGYTCHAPVLNSKDYGVPQNRDRIFLVGMLDPRNYYFPEPFKLERRLKDLLEENVDEKFYISDKMLEYFNRVNEDKSHGHNFTPKDGDDIAFTLRTVGGGESMTTLSNVNVIGKINSSQDGVVVSPHGIAPTHTQADTVIVRRYSKRMDNGEIIQLGNLFPDTDGFKNKTSGRVYSIEGLAPTLNTAQGGGKTPIIVIYEEQEIGGNDNQTPCLSK